MSKATARVAPICCCTWHAVAGVGVSGVMVAIVWGRRESETHAWENTQGSLLTGVLLGLLAAVCLKSLH